MLGEKGAPGASPVILCTKALVALPPEKCAFTALKQSLCLLPCPMRRWVPGKIVEARHRLQQYWKVGMYCRECTCYFKRLPPFLAHDIVAVPELWHPCNVPVLDMD